jgi:hypothetical protein
MEAIPFFPSPPVQIRFPSTPRVLDLSLAYATHTLNADRLRPSLLNYNPFLVEQVNSLTPDSILRNEVPEECNSFRVRPRSRLQPRGYDEESRQGHDAEDVAEG